MITYKGLWRVRVIAKDSAWPQRVVISGASSGGGILPGVIGTSQLVDGNEWSLTIDHDDGSGFKPNEAVVADPMQEVGAELRQIVRTKDHFTSGDTDPNDLVLRVEKVGPMFALPVRPYAVDTASLLMQGDGIFVDLQGRQFMGVELRNTWGKDYGDEVLFDISDLGRATLATFGIVVRDDWSPAALQATQQVVQGRAIRIEPLAIGRSTTVYFQVDTTNAHRGKPDVDFVLLNLSGTPDPGNAKRHNARVLFIAELGYDSDTGAAVIRTPEGTATVKLKSLAVDPHAVFTLCRNLRRGMKPYKSGGRSQLSQDAERILAASRQGSCDARTLRELLEILCRCLRDGDGKLPDCGKGGKDCDPCGDDGGWQRVCYPGVIWLPLKFDFTVEIQGGFPGQFGPLAFQDPWWKIVLLIIALVAWLVGFIAQIVGDQTGWGNAGDFDQKIGTVGDSNRITTDAAIIELDGSRPAIQKVIDAVTGEVNAQPIVALDTVIPIDPQVAFPSLSFADVVGKLVYKSGSRTGLTHGIITSIGPFTQSRSEDGTADPNHPDLVFQADQFRIAPDLAFGEELFDDHGDSGSLVLSREPDSMHRVVGLLHSGSGGTSPIQDILAALNLKLQ